MRSWFGACMVALLFLTSWLPIAPAFVGIPLLQTAAGSLAILATGAATVTDLRAHRIPNWLTGPAFTLGFGMNFVTIGSALPTSGERPASHRCSWQLEPCPSSCTLRKAGLVGIQDSMLGAMSCFLVMYLVYRLAGSGAGDVKLAAALGALMGLRRGMNAVALAYLLAGASMLCWAIMTRGPVSLARDVLGAIGWRIDPARFQRPTDEAKSVLKTPVPLAGFFFVSTIVVISQP